MVWCVGEEGLCGCLGGGGGGGGGCSRKTYLVSLVSVM